MDDSPRFDRARATLDYKLAFLDDVPATGLRPTAAVAGMMIVVALVVVVSLARPIAGAIVAAAGAVALGALAWGMLAARRAPIVRVLSIISSTWSGLRGGSLEVLAMARSITLRDAHGNERVYRMSRAVVGDALVGAIGLATIRGNTVVQFAVLDA